MANEKRLIYANEFQKALENADADVCETYHDCYCDCGFSRNVIMDIVDSIPTVDAVPVVHGEWLDGYAVDSNGKKVYDSIDCSVCNDIFKIKSEDREYWKDRFKVCPFCGAVMDGGNEDG